MTTTASLEATSVRLDPGEEVEIPLQIRNNGDLVEGYVIDVVGVPASWAVVEPPETQLYPGTSTTATVTFRPPRSSAVPAGELPFGVRVTPTQHPEEAVVPEGVVEILPFLETAAELIPRTSQGRRAGRHQVAVDDRGNVAVTVLVEGRDDSQLLRFRVSPPAVSVGAGEARFAAVRVRSRDRLWWGQPVTHPFEIVVSPQDSSSVMLPGSYLQQPLIPRWLPKLLLALLALLLALLLLWFVVLKPTIDSQAEDAAKKAVADDVAAAKQAGQEAQDSAGAAGNAADDAQQNANHVRDQLGKPREPATVATPFAERLSSNGTVPAIYFVPDEQTLKLTDLVLGNPRGDFGQVTVSSAGNPLFVIALENFRDLDYHFVTPITVPGGGDVTMTVDCREPGRPPEGVRLANCATGLYLGGELTREVPRRPIQPAAQGSE